MKKSNQKGFMLAEAFIVSTFVLGVLVFMFIQIRTIINGFDKSFTYNTASDLYKTKELSKIIMENVDHDTVDTTINNNGYVIFNKELVNQNLTDDFWNQLKVVSNVKTLILSRENLSVLRQNINNNNDISNKLKEFIRYIKVDNEEGNRIIVEYMDNTYASIKL